MESALPFSRNDSPTGFPKSEAYQAAFQAIEATLEGIDDPISAQATVAAILYWTMPHYSWCGFYRVTSPGMLTVGPYQGTLGCLTIAFGRGVCGACAQRRETVIVPDVEAFPGHIACDAKSRSEIVLPVFDRMGALIAVLDVDSTLLAAFDEEDHAGLRAIVEWLARK